MQNLVNRTLICLSVCIPVIFCTLLLAGNLDYKSQLLSFFPKLNNATTCRSGSSPLRVYMYDLPPRFNIGMMDSSFPNNTAATAANFPPWRWNDGLRRQHSVEYWMMASLLHERNGSSGSGQEAVRVRDPNSADVFFVPFFSSCSVSIYVRNMTEKNTLDEKFQLEMINILRESEYWKRSNGRDHVIPLHHPNAFRHYRDVLNASIFIVADFGRITHISRLAKDVVAPYAHMLESYDRDDNEEDPFESRKTLLFFRGRAKRKDEGKIRAKLHKMLNGTKDVIYEDAHASEEGFKASTEHMRSSKFCLHPAGDTPSSCRLFDAIVSHCVPVIISDKIELPFENELDYKEFSIFFSDNESLKPGYIVSELRKISKEKWVKMWVKLKSVSHHFEFQNPPIKDDAVNMIWRQVKHKLPYVKLAIHRSRRLKIHDWWRS